MEKQAYITDDEMDKCQKVIDVFTELFENEDLVVLNAGRFGFVKLQYFKFPFGFDTVNVFYDSKSLFDELWEQWLDMELLNLADDMKLLEMDYDDILKCLPEEKQKELFDKRLYFAEKTGIDGIAKKSENCVQKMSFMEPKKQWSKDWGHFDWEQIRKNLSEVEKKKKEGKEVDKTEIGISLSEFGEYFEWLYNMQPEIYYRNLLFLLLVRSGVPQEKAQLWVGQPEESIRILQNCFDKDM